ncbi:hypothetical protein KUTeg_019436 [Tegillarca granosa]|uniref:Methyltransferase type 11 domain-containing protein n=1 Tax=Tegillarca granosa TaxID=220873 RepID=A0ABQ9EHM3_TEGGR|nr:hypothetical protein KUTeg_019436 [Tegillarca granosa]
MRESCKDNIQDHYIMSLTGHEENVSKFYSRVVDGNHDWNEGFLTFGLWKTKSGEPIPRPLCYRQLYDELLENSGILPHHNVLEVACGQGSGMKRINANFGCIIQGIDVSEANVKLGKRRLRDTGIEIIRGSATKMPYNDNAFDYIVCVEGGPHFNTREDFFKEAFRVLKPGGKLFMADVVTTKSVNELNFVNKFILKVGTRSWVVAPENITFGLDVYEQQFKNCGFINTNFTYIGHRVYPGYCAFNCKLSTMRQQARIRGVFEGYIGGPVIDISVKLLFSKKIIEYVFVEAVKPL